MFFFSFLTTFGPHHFWPKPPIGPFLSNRFVPKPLRTILDPKKNFWSKGLLFGTICCSCLVFWAMDLLARDPSPKTTLCGISRWLLWCVVLWCCVSVRCVCSKIFVGASKMWALPRLPSAGPPLPTPLPLRRTAQNFSIFLSRHYLHSFFHSCGHFVEFWWCLKRRCNCARWGSRAVV